MKILFLARRFPPSVGGMERFAYDLSNALDERTKLIKVTWGGSNKWLPVVLPWMFLRACFILLRNPDIRLLHIQDGVQAPIGWLLHVLYRRPYIVVAHGLDITYSKYFYQRLILPFVRRADYVVSISSATHDEVLKRGVSKERAKVITLGVSDDYGVEPKGDRKKLGEELGVDLKDRAILLTTGRLVRRKGVAWFASNVLPELVRSNPSLLYVVVGEGAERQPIEAVLAEHDLSENVLVAGRVSDEVRSLLYRTSDIFVMPNIVVPGDMEGFGIVAHEAAVAELPVVASDLEGIKDALTNKKNGMLVPTGDSGAFVSAITDLLDDEPRRKEFGRAARQYTLETFGWDHIADEYLEVYESVTK